MSSGRAFSALPPLGSGKENTTQRGRSSPAITSIEKKSNSVFRYGETMESLFDVCDESDPVYVSVCEDLASSGPCPQLWRRVLQLTHLRGSSLLRLYRRATNRFPMNENEESVHTLEIWLSYARMVSNQAEILDYVGKVAWSRKHAMYFVCRAELDPPNALQHLRSGLSQNASPREALDAAVLSLASGETQLSTGSDRGNQIARSSDSSQPVSDPHKSNTSQQKESRKRRALQPLCDPATGPSSATELDLRDRVSSSFLQERSKVVDTEEKKSGATKEQKDASAAFQLKPPPSVDGHAALPLLGSATTKRAEKPPLSRRLRPVGRIGKAARAEPNAINKRVLGEDEETEPPTKRPSKFTKKDLAYMFDWNPEERKNGGSGNTQEEVTVKSTSNTNSSNEQDEEEEKEETRPANSSSPPSNAEFLRLISEKNMIQVNGASYMKLDVVGKGGSSKVYRVMSSDAKIWAIKKVSLGSETLRQDTLNGYMNEIGLLKRLKNNPSIINLRDSEIIPDKIIFMVMEVGEADLNFVLQQQRQSSSLNLNFIRLTWFQMLKAVHSIHEARIIHGDLKPANFLFVRGSLKLIDFGIAKAMQNDDTTNIYRESQTGTLNYMSPESIKQNESKLKCGRPSDIWSLGCILYQMIYGHPPFAKINHLFGKLQAIVNPKHAIEFPPADAAALESIRLCLERDPQARAPINGENGLLTHRFLNSS